MVADHSIQHALPDAVVPVPPAWLRALFAAIQAAQPVLLLLVWAALAVALLALLWVLARRLLGRPFPWRWGMPADAADEVLAWQPDVGVARGLLREADALAAAERYGDAARLVLRRSIEDVERRRPALVQPATTSRDLAMLGILPDTARPAFAAIVEVVECSLFAGRGADQHGWSQARAAYARFARVDQW